MTKATSTPAESTSLQGPDKKAYVDLIRKKLPPSQTRIDDEKESQIKMIDKVGNVHKGALALHRRLEKMDAAKRQEFLFHFDLGREHLEWDKSKGLPLGDRDSDDDEHEEGISTAPADGEPDLRPRFLKQPGASVDEPARGSASVTQLNPAKRGTSEAADAAEARLSQVGRGPVKPDPGTKH